MCKHFVQTANWDSIIRIPHSEVQPCLLASVNKFFHLAAVNVQEVVPWTVLCTLAKDNKIMHKKYRKLSVFGVFYRVPVQDCAGLISDHDYYNLFKQKHKKHWQSFSLVLILSLICFYTGGALKCENTKYNSFDKDNELFNFIKEMI